jgi:hypothetical protein
VDDFASTYREYSADELAALQAQVGSLTDDASVALLSEIQQRGLSDEALASLRNEQVKRTATVKEEWRESRKYDASRVVTRFAIRIALVIAAGIIAAIFAVLSSKH